jgi:hypothetical protein
VYNFTDKHYIFCDAGETFDSFAMVCAHPEFVDGDAYREENPNQMVLPDTGMHISQLPGADDSPLAQGYRNINRGRDHKRVTKEDKALCSVF